MNAGMAYLGAGLAGALLGLVFFLGLWATVRRLREARHPALWMLGSVLLRLGLVSTGFVLIARYGGWEHLLVAAAAFLLPRFILVRRMQSARITREPNT